MPKNIEVKASNYNHPQLDHPRSMLQFEIPESVAEEMGRNSTLLVEQSDVEGLKWKIEFGYGSKSKFSKKATGGFVCTRKTINLPNLPLFGRSPCKARVDGNVILIDLLPKEFRQVSEREDIDRHSVDYLRKLLADLQVAQRSNCGYKLMAEGDGTTIEVEKLFWEPTGRRIYANGDEF